MAKTVEQIARDLNLSVTTVRLVLNGKAEQYRISSKTQARINEHVDQYGYVLNHSARSLKLNKTDTLGLIVPNISNVFFATLAEKLELRCRRSGYQLTDLGLNQGTAGNISARVDGGMLITPTGIPYEMLTPEQIVFVDDDGRHEAGKLPSSEWRFHQAVYQTRPDAHAVVHNHAVHSTAVSILNRPIPAIHYMIAAAGGNSIPCAPYATFGPRVLSEYVRTAMGDRKATLLQHHGMIACGENLQKALWLAQEVEVLAKLYLTTLAIVDPVPVLTDEEIAVVLEKFENYGLRIEE